LSAHFARTGATLEQRLRTGTLLAMLFASACGRSTRNDNQPTAGRAGAGGSPSGGNTNAGTYSDAGSSNGNPCTLDSFSAETCHHDPAPDGQLCEDGSFCTLGDSSRWRRSATEAPKKHDFGAMGLDVT
jgi:hypothetical protein